MSLIIYALILGELWGYPYSIVFGEAEKVQGLCSIIFLNLGIYIRSKNLELRKYMAVYSAITFSY